MTNVLVKLMDEFALGLFGMTKGEALDKNICICCKENVNGRLNGDLEIREYKISGLCGPCFERNTNGD